MILAEFSRIILSLFILPACFSQNLFFIIPEKHSKDNMDEFDRIFKNPWWVWGQRISGGQREECRWGAMAGQAALCRRVPAEGLKQLLFLSSALIYPYAKMPVLFYLESNWNDLLLLVVTLSFSSLNSFRTFPGSVISVLTAISHLQYQVLNKSYPSLLVILFFRVSLAQNDPSVSG